MPTITFVCTANQCRSPLAEHLLRAALGPGSPWTVRSAGTHALPGRPMDPSAEQVLGERGIRFDGWTGTMLTRPVVEESDLILTAAHAHLERVLQLRPGAVHRAFVLAQFAAFLNAAADEGADEQITDVADIRRLVLIGRRGVEPGEPTAWDLADPVGGPVAGFRHCAATLDVLIAPLTRLLGGAQAEPVSATS